MRYKKLVASLALAAIDVHALEGTVVNASGQPIKGAEISTVASKPLATTDIQGAFSVADDVVELHIKAPGYSHKILRRDEFNTTGGNLLIELASTVIEQVDVIGLPIHASAIESALPVAVLTGDALREQQAATLGDSLARQPGVNTNFHGNVVSTPVIRGLSGPRVLITQNSLDVSDVSRVGPDHAVTTEVSTVQQVEILRGPATLFYGSGAIGGVVNVVDQRVPTDSTTRGEYQLSHDTVNDQNTASFSGVTGGTQFGLYADGFWRQANDYEAPEINESEPDEGDDAVANSDDDSSGYTLGASYLFDRGYVGVSAGRLEREYGIPGHSHGHEGGDERVFSDVEQDRYQLLSEIQFDSTWLQSIKTSAAYTEYEHAEIEEGAVGTVFANETTELRLDALHQPLQGWKGGINIHYKDTDFSAEGDEAFTPPSNTETIALAIMEEKHFGDVLLQLGARAEQVTIEANQVLLPEIEAHLHEDDGLDDDDDHDHEHGESVTRVFDVEHDFTPISVSVGAVWDFAPGYNIGVSLSRAERAPSSAELLSFGPHIGTRTYEVGALFNDNISDGEAEFELTDSDIELETSNNIDLTFRKYEGDVGLIINLFYNQVDDYYYQRATGLFAESGHDHDDGDDHDHSGEGDDHAGEDEHADELPVFITTHADAQLYGFEAQAIVKLSDHWQTTVFSDYVRAKLDDGGDLPRTPPLRFGADLNFGGDSISAKLSWTHYTEQDKTAELETSTDGFDIFDASVTYRLPLGFTELDLFAKAENITDSKARVHTSFIKDVAPLPGRNFSIGLRGTF